jgi:hypothetical protein
MPHKLDYVNKNLLPVTLVFPAQEASGELVAMPEQSGCFGFRSSGCRR